MFPYRQKVTAEELEFALGVADAAARKRGPYRNPESYPGLPMDDGSAQALKVKDTALARGTMAVIDQFGPEKGGAITYRIMCLMDLLQEPELKPYRRDVPGEAGALEFRNEVIAVAAEHPIMPDGGFEKGSFVQAVERMCAPTP